MKPPRLKKPGARKAAKSAYREEEATEQYRPPTDDDDFLSFGDDAGTEIKNHQDSASRGRVREFFITVKEVSAGSGSCTVRVHLAFNYADKDFAISVPRITVPKGDRFESYTSAGPDCALAAGGLNPSVRPAYVLIDHRQYKTKDNKVGGDEVKVWIPPASTMALLDKAIDDLCENLGEDRDEIDLRNHVLKITKSGTGRSSSWALSFGVKEAPLDEDIEDRVSEFFGTEPGQYPGLSQYRKVMRKILAPDPRFMLSKNGGKVYQKAAAPSRAKSDDSDDTEVPF